MNLEKLIRRALSIASGSRPAAESTLLFLPFEQADPLETQIPFDERKFSIGSDLIPGTTGIRNGSRRMNADMLPSA